jgi:hypothetical protein
MYITHIFIILVNSFWQQTLLTAAFVTTWIIFSKKKKKKTERLILIWKKKQQLNFTVLLLSIKQFVIDHLTSSTLEITNEEPLWYFVKICINTCYVDRK